jgi:DedD protein
VNIRNLDQIQESDAPRTGYSLGTLLLSAIACGALVVAAVSGFNRNSAPTVAEADPLRELLAEASLKASPPAAVVDRAHVTFPGVLSDGKSPTTALAAVRDEGGRLVAAVQPSAHAPVDPSLPNPEAGQAVLGLSGPSTDAMRKQPLPAGDLLNGTPITQDPKDDLSQLTKLQGNLDPGTGMAPPGEQGGHEIQVASFQNGADADLFVEELRKRGHRAYQQAAYVPERGLWHRVRIGPFSSGIEARRYQASFEKQERVSTFLIDPDKVKRQEELRAAKVKAREDKAERKRRRTEHATR